MMRLGPMADAAGDRRRSIVSGCDAGSRERLGGWCARRAVPPVSIWVRPCRKRGGRCQQCFGSMSFWARPSDWHLGRPVGLRDGRHELAIIAGLVVPVDAPEGRSPVAAVLVMVAVVPLRGYKFVLGSWGSQRAQSSRNPEWRAGCLMVGPFSVL